MSACIGIMLANMHVCDTVIFNACPLNWSSLSLLDDEDPGCMHAIHACSTDLRTSLYVIYKPRLQGAGEGFISGKLPMTEDEGRIFVEYTE